MCFQVSIITITLNRESLKRACESVEKQTYKNWHHYVLGDGVLPNVYDHPQRSILGFSKVMGITEPGANMPNGTPNPMQRWALKHLELGEYVCFLDDDNCYDPQYLEKMVHELDSKKDVGLVLCGAQDLRYGQNIDGYPEEGRCDNSAAMYRREVVKDIEFPHASMDKNVIQDVEYIILCTNKYSYVNINEKLLIFGEGLNPPPNRGKYYFLESWKIPQEAYYKAIEGKYVEALNIFRNIIDEYKNDAWSLWKCFELSVIINDKDSAIQYAKKWNEIYECFGYEHHALFFANATFLKYIGDKNFMKSVKEALDLLLKEKETPEKYFALARNYRLLDKKNEYDESLQHALELNADSNYWAYQLFRWECIVYENLFPQNKGVYKID